jgi:serine/threonine protein kinase
VKGTQKFVAPEVLLSDDKSPYTNAVDIWSAGMIAFLVLTGMPNMNFKSMLRYSVGLEKSFPDQTLITQEVSSVGRSFVQALLSRDANDRPSATESLQHSWTRQTNDLSQDLRTMEIQGNRDADAGANVTNSQSHPRFVSRPAVLTAHSTGSLLPTAQWSTNQSQPGKEDFRSEDTAVPLSAQVPMASKSDPALPEADSL